MNTKQTGNNKMLDKDTLEWIRVLDNPHSHLHHDDFKSLKNELIKQMIATDFIDDFGMVMNTEQEVHKC